MEIKKSFKSIQELMEAAKNGDNSAKEKLERVFGQYFEKGELVRAFKLLKRLSEIVPDADYKCTLGKMYYYGDGTEQNYENAYRCFIEAEQQGCEDAIDMLGHCYKDGHGTEKNDELAISYFERAAEKGFINSLIALEEYKKKGKVKVISESIYNSFLNNADPEGIRILGVVYILGMELGMKYLTGKKGTYIENHVIKDEEKGLLFLNIAAEKGDIKALETLGHMYENGYFVEQDTKKAYDYIKKTECKTNFPELITVWLGQLSLKNNDYMSAYKYFLDAYEGGLERYEYYLDIFEELNGREIISIESTSELSLDDIDMDRIGAVYINPKINSSHNRNTLYNIVDYKKCKKNINAILEDVDYVDESKSNELEVFMQIYVKLAKLIRYNEVLKEGNNNNTQDFFVYRNLIGALTQHESVCAGIAETLRNALLERGIECICVSGDEHAYNQVKIDGKWYYVDLTFDRELICNGEELENCLKSKSSFVQIDPSHINAVWEKVEESPEDYPKEIVDNIYRKVLKKYSDGSIIPECEDIGPTALRNLYNAIFAKGDYGADYGADYGEDYGEDYGDDYR